jgi:hypothetical protein
MPDAVLFKFATSENSQAALRRHNGLVGTKLGLNKDLTLVQQARKSEMWPLFKEAKAMGKRALWRLAKLFINDIQICPPSFFFFLEAQGPEIPMHGIMEHARRWCK